MFCVLMNTRVFGNHDNPYSVSAKTISWGVQFLEYIEHVLANQACSATAFQPNIPEIKKRNLLSSHVRRKILNAFFFPWFPGCLRAELPCGWTTEMHLRVVMWCRKLDLTRRGVYFSQRCWNTTAMLIPQRTCGCNLNITTFIIWQLSYSDKSCVRYLVRDVIRKFYS